ncbi:MAG: HDIG domain-containing protein [Phototrophicaceae bacterium]
MIERLQDFIETQFSIPRDDLLRYSQRGAVTFAGILFVLVATLIVAFDSIFLRFNSASGLEVGQIADRNIVAPANGGSYVSNVLTDIRRAEAQANVQPIYSAPEPDIARIWGERAEQTLDFIEDIRATNRYASEDQQLVDLSRMEYLLFSNTDHAIQILNLDEDTWNGITAEVDRVLTSVYRNRIIDEQVYINNQLVVQISSTFDNRTSDLIFDIVDNFVKPNTFENTVATEAERERVANEVQPIELTFAGGQIIIGENERISEEQYEALVAFNLIQPEDLRFKQFLRALIASTITLVIFGLYISRFSPNLLYNQGQRLTIVAVIFLITLALTRLLGVSGNIYLFPTAAMALLFVAISDAPVAIIGTLGLAFLTGIIANDSMEITTLIAAGGIIGTLGLKRAESLNQFFVAGILIGIINAIVVIIFNFGSTSVSGDFSLIAALAFTIFSGFVSSAVAMAAMYVLTLFFNLPTVLKLIDLQQPNKPLLQRLLREAPGTYQHSLQVGNLAEQAANAIGADAQLTHVAALYHDIGKMHNPLYFTENQQDIGNPHDTLNDPYRSADIIISHITEGDEIAKQAGLPQRIRDFIREHHGTTQVFVFYQRALNAVDGDKAAVDISDFTYPGPKPRSKETAILMLADSCEAAVRSIKPQSKQEISDLISKIIDSKRGEGQLDESNLTLNDLRTIRDIFVDILQGMFHPRINYSEAVSKKLDNSEPKSLPTKGAPPSEDSNGVSAPKTVTKVDAKKQSETTKVVEDKPNSATRTIPKLATTTSETEIADEEPLAEVPRLPSLDERRATTSLKASDTSEDLDEDNIDDA